MIFLTVGTFLEMNSSETEAFPEKIINASVKNSDKAIQINWNLLINENNIDGIEILIKGKGVNHKKNFSVNENKYSFVEGKHGNGYAITILAKKGKKTVGKYDTRAVFLDYSKLPDLPIISINTRNSKYPYFKMADKPPKTLGVTSTDNEYLECDVLMTQNNIKIANSTAKVRVRGNTSATNVNKSYKLELDSAADLLELGNAYADKEWALLNQGITQDVSINSYFVNILANLVGVDWQPRVRFVNVVINGRWDGCYILSESVKRSPKRMNISPSGYIFEYDPYFWKPNTTYFRTTHTNKFFAYTFKYPKKKNINTYSINRLKAHLQEFENLLYEKDERYTEYIDLDSFATWILVHDIIGTADGPGSNMYFYKYDFDLENPNSSKIKRGPFWDCGASFTIEDDWSKPHGIANYLKQLFEMKSFRQAYKDKFYSVKDKILPTLKAETEKFNKTQMKAVQESWNLHAERWNTPKRNTKNKVQYNLKYLQKKLKWLDKKLKTNNWK